MKRLLPFFLVAMIAMTVSCKKFNKDKPKSEYGVDGVTPIPEAVDLGLPSGLKWASFNLGASKDYEYGDYYAWGETATKEVYTWDTYAFGSGSDKLTKYCPKDKTNFWDATAKPEGPDGETILLPSDDVVHVKLGGKWRMPTRDEFKELLALKTNDDYTWEELVPAVDSEGNEIKDAGNNVIYGLRVTRISTGATLFFPAAGSCTDRSNGTGVGFEGNYWSSYVYPDSPFNACCLAFFSGYSDCCGYFRCFGVSVRPVKD